MPFLRGRAGEGLYRLQDLSGAVGALIAGVAWAGSDVFALLVPARRDGILVESADIIAEAGMLAALVGLHVLRARNLGRMGVVGFALVFVGVVATLVGIIPPNSPLAQTLEPLGGLLFGIATFRAGLVPRWCGLLLAVYPHLVIVSLPVNGPGILVGLLWLAVGLRGLYGGR